MPAVDSNPPSRTDELDLEARARSGDRAAVVKLLDRLGVDLARFCHRYLGDLHEAEDAAQDVLIVLTKEGRWPQGGLAWVLRVARNRCLDLAKRRQDGRVGVGAFGNSQLPSPRTGPRTALARQQEHELLRQHISSLTQPHGEVLMLRYFEDLSRKEIAEVLELSESVVKSRLFEARKELRWRMKELMRYWIGILCGGLSVKIRQFWTN